MFHWNVNTPLLYSTWDLVYFTTRVSNMSDTSATRMRQVRHECYMNGTSPARVKNFDFDDDTSEKIFSHPYVSYMANERLQGAEQFHSINYLFTLPCSVPLYYLCLFKRIQTHTRL